ncbi:actin-binding, cofilin/tropomyosin type [Purpureocillium lavendulum]|uniref:Twinfilin n=1 Tax=Purpureocillium lavendulum TaxID=1247861 RepID=A0AB34G558_9HYPO|nr:actin-binding, cofilin/tropomyosin type [Purpureocillium lavendulum]
MNPVNTKPYRLPDDATWLITGCSSGIGREIAKYIYSQPGQRVIATARDPTTLSYLPDEDARVFKTALDVTSRESVDKAFEAAAAHFGDSLYVDVVVNNAGYSLSGDTESATEEQTHDEIETLFFGTARVTMRAVGLMRQDERRRGGIIFNVSSLAGVCAFAGHAYYHAGKFAVEGWTESVAREMHPDWNINFCIAEPSGVKTNFEGGSKKYMAPHPAYAGEDMPARKLEAYVKKGLQQGAGIEPVAIAQGLFKVASGGDKIPLHLPMGPVAAQLIRSKLEGRLADLKAVEGLSASEELQAQFSSFVSAPNDFALVVTIEREALVPVASIPSKSSSFNDNLASLQEHVKPNVANYFILRRFDDAPQFLAVTYVPDAAPVRHKMLFASTRLTLVRELGTENFRETIFTTTAEELTPNGFKKHDAHTKLAAPLTEEERTLGEVKRAEQEAGAGTGTREIHLSKSLAMPVTEDAIAALKELEGRGRAVVMLKINSETEVVELVPESPTPSSISELAQVISPSEPRFTFYRFAHTHNGAEQEPLLFFYTCPVTPGNKAIKSRMLYPLMKRAVLEIADREAGLKLEKRFEVEEPSEITEQSVLDDLHPKVAARQGFSRPKRPGR